MTRPILATKICLSLCLLNMGLFANVARAQRAESAADLLALLGVDHSELAKFTDEEPVTDDELELIRRILYHVPRFDAVDVVRWLSPMDELASIAASPDENRAKMVNLTGRVVEIQSMRLTPKQAKRFRFQNLFRVVMELSERVGGPDWKQHGIRRVVVYCRKVPSAWGPNASSPISLNTSVQALFLKLAEGRNAENSTGDRPVLFFAAERLAWHPNANDSMAVSKGVQYLGSLGMDVGLFDDLQHGKKLSAEDRECFYQMLSVIERVDSHVISKIARTDFSIPSLLKKPTQEVGKVYQLTGTARRAIRIEVHDTDIRERFGIEEYYEVHVFVPLARQLLLFDPDTGEKVEFHDYRSCFASAICRKTLRSVQA